MLIISLGFAEFIQNFFNEKQSDQDVKNKLYALNSEEKEILKEMIDVNQQTKYLNWDDYYNVDKLDEYNKISGIFTGLDYKKIGNITTNNSTGQFTILPKVWILLKKNYENIF